MQLAGKTKGGDAIAIPFTARTPRLRIREKNLVSVDLAGIGAARSLTNLETSSDAIHWLHLEELASLPKLTDLSLSADAKTDLAVLAKCPVLEHLFLKLHGRKSLEVGWISDIPRLKTLSFHCVDGAPNIQVPLRALEKLSFDGAGNSEIHASKVTKGLNATSCAKLTSLTFGTTLSYLHVMACPKLPKLSLDALAGSPIEVLHLTGLHALEKLDFSPLASCEKLRSLTLVGHGVGYLDFGPLAGIASLERIQVDGETPSLSTGGKILSPAVRAWRKAGRLETD